MSDPFIQFREVDRQIADFDRREAQLTEEMQRLQRQLRDRELAKAPADPKQLDEDLKSLHTTHSNVLETLKLARREQSKLQRQIDAIPSKVDERVAKHLERDYANKPESVRKLATVKLRAEISSQLEQSRIAYQERYDVLSSKTDALDAETKTLERRIATLEKVSQAVKSQRSNPTDLDTIQKSFKDIDRKHLSLEQERSVFNRNEGKTGEKAKMRLQSEMMDRVNVALRAHGFVDTISVVEQVAKSITELDGPERTYLYKTAVGNKFSLLNAVSPHDTVRFLITEGDVSHGLSEEIDKIVSALDQAVESNKDEAARWWKTGAFAKPHLDKIHGLLVTKFKNRFRRTWREALAQWIKKELS
jgi:chromosome segregation ATPase